jgi:DNA polymerase I
MGKERLYLVDGMSHVYRSFYAIRGLSTSKGLPTNAVYGFTMMLRKIINEDKPEYLAVCFDTPERTFRHDAYENYKVNRALPPNDLVPQFAYVERLCEVFRVPLIKLPGYEADDVIGTLARKASQEGLKVVIASNDKDMCQLVNEDVCIQKWDKTRNYILCDSEGVKEWLGVKPDQVVDLLGLMGDASDNVPGAPGIGEKGALQLIEQFGSIEGAIEHWSEVSRKTYRESLHNNAEQIRLSRRLVTIDTNIPVELNLDTLRRHEPDYQAACLLFAELEFNALLREYSAYAGAAGQPILEQRAVSPVPVETLDYRSVASNEELKNLLNRIWSVDSFSFAVSDGADSESNNSAKTVQPLKKISISFSPGSVEKLDLTSPEIDSTHTLNELRDIWTNGIIGKTVHDSKQALSLLNNAYRQLSGTGAAGRDLLCLDGLKDDTLLAAYLLSPEKLRYRLSELAQEYLAIDSSQSSEFDAADLTERLAPVLRRRLSVAGLENIYLNFELPLVEILYEMEQVGVAIDTGALSDLSAELEKLIEKVTSEIHELAGQQFNINSTQQLGEIFEKLNLDTSSKTKTGRMSTNAKVMEDLASRYELPRKILDYRELTKLKSTYIDALPKLISPETGRLHTTFNQTIATTGRLSSTNPNLQNIPVRSELGKRIRRAFIAGEGYVLLSADYSQIELRLLAHITGDPIMTDAFQKGEDIHTKTAREVFGAKTDVELKAKRRLAKATNFGIAYGVGAFGLSQNVGINRREAKEAIDNYYETYKGVRRYMEELPEQARKEDGVVRTLFGRIRRLPDLNNQNHNLRARAEREAINAPIQGTAADLVKLAMIKVDRRLRAEKLHARLLLQVHDELLFEVLPREVERVKELVKSEMENVYPLSVPLLVEVRTGKNWMELK